MSVEATVERVLRLLELLQRRPAWSAAELAESLDVTQRTIRRDIDRLRALGYPMQSAAGVGGGYRLGAGGQMPPLLLDDQEAVATAVALRLASSSAIAGSGPAGLRALRKLDQVLPPRLRHEVRAVQQSTATLATTGIDVDPESLLVLARACRDRVRVTFGYTTGAGNTAVRTVEPVQMVTTGPRWYLMAWDIDRTDWRTFRLDRITELSSTSWTFAERAHPDPLEYVRHSVALAPYTVTARLRMRTDVAELRSRVPVQVGQVHNDAEPGWCVLIVAADDLEWIAMYVAELGFDAQIVHPPQLRDTAAALAARLSALAESGTPVAAEPGAAGPGGDRTPEAQ